ncbi:hypothetical protein LWI29_008011 [Acer saccharum]|uniref:Uncharacterized protein n=1 Tax=Acer saccharum TaxID=4024 RepID=A0AA39SUC8_ACESA|nr:hypothetical protein LWI29_008011 [Acer saccharum]
MASLKFLKLRSHDLSRAKERALDLIRPSSGDSNTALGFPFSELVATAKQQLQFLAAVDRNLWLYQGPALQKAIYRSEDHFQTEFSGSGLGRDSRGEDHFRRVCNGCQIGATSFVYRIRCFGGKFV